MITDHKYRPFHKGTRDRCAYMNCGRPVAEHAHKVRKVST